MDRLQPQATFGLPRHLERPRAPTTRGLTPSQEEVDDQDDQQHAADAATDHRAAIVETATATKQKQQDDDNQNNVHVFSGMSLALLGRQPSATCNFRKLCDGDPEALNRFHDGGQSFTAWRLCDVPVSVIVVCGVDWLRAWIECSIHRDRHAERAEDPPKLSYAGIPLLLLLLSAIVGG